jgi:hypothetical protein
MSAKERAAEDKFLDENIEKGYIVPSELLYRFATFQVPKKDSDKMQYIIDYQPLNKVTRRDVTPLPSLAQCIEDLQGMEIYSKFNIRWGYNNIRIQEEDQWKAVFKTSQGLFEPKVMFFGISNSPGTFQRFINYILEPWYQKYGRKKGKNYMDDIGIATLVSERDLHIAMTNDLFNILAEHGLHLKLSKSIFMQPHMDQQGWGHYRPSKNRRHHRMARRNHYRQRSTHSTRRYRLPPNVHPEVFLPSSTPYPPHRQRHPI